MNLCEAIRLPTLFPMFLDFELDSVHFIRLVEQDYVQASFLDSRILQPNTPSARIDWKEINDAIAELPVNMDFIFHISHTGSTLISRMLGQHPSCFSLREPAVLRQITEKQGKTRTVQVLKLLARTFRKTQRALVKTTSFVSEIGPELMARSCDSRAILMYIRPQSFLPAMLGGAMSDIEHNLQSRWSRLFQLGLVSDSILPNLSAGESVAATWLCEYVSLAAISQLYPSRTLWLDFEQFLKDQQLHTQQLQDFLGLSGSPSLLLNPQIMNRYAKQPQAAFDSMLRQSLIGTSMRENQLQVEQGLLWLQEHHFNLSNLL